MSSATVLFVLARLMRELTAADNGAPVLSFAFGPGLTLEAMLLTVAAESMENEVNMESMENKASVESKLGVLSEAS